MRSWGKRFPKVQANSLLKTIVSELSSGLVHLRDEDRSFLRDILSHTDWFGPYCEWGKQKVIPQMYSDRANGPDEYLAAATIASIARKYEGPLVTHIDPKVNARLRFEKAELMCRLTNKRLRHHRNYPNRPLDKKVGAHAILHRMRSKIWKWLDSSPDLQDVVDRARHGPGGNLSTGRPYSTPYYKFRGDFGSYKVGRGAHALARAAIVTNDSWRQAICCEANGVKWRESHLVSYPQSLNWETIDARLELVDYNKVTFVPKDAFTERAIAIEPDLNIYLQLGVGAVIRERLKKAGCNLNDQTRNHALAWLGSIEHSWCDPVTIDLSMASDTVSYELVKEVLPPDWFSLLNRLRSPQGRKADGTVINWAKFSSMGNGYTFELESLIFYALAQSVQDELGVTDFFRENGQHAYEYVGVYGDDIIIPAICYPKLEAMLRYLGFQVNWDKSFIAGPFRESCGKDWWNGRDVRPVFLREEIMRQGDLVKVRNGLVSFFETHPTIYSGTPIDDIIQPKLDVHLWTHLRGVGKGMHSAYLNFPIDQCHASGLVTYDRDYYQAFKHPVVIEKAKVYRGNARWRYLQFLYAATSRSDPEDQSSLTDIVSRQRRLCPLTQHIAQGGNPGDVVRAECTEPKITYRTM